MKPVAPPESPGQKAVRLLNEQLTGLESVRGLNYKDPVFKAWRVQTRSYLELFLPQSSAYIDSFDNLYFASRSFRRAAWGSRPKPSGYVSREDQYHFAEDCKTAEGTIKAVVKYIEEFGVHSGHDLGRPVGQVRAAEKTSGGLHQTFNAPVSLNQAIATDNATQNVGHLGDAMAMGSSLEEIRGLFEQSRSLTQGQVREGLVAVDALSLQIQKPAHQRNWKSVLDYGQALLALADKATDLAHKLALYLPAVATLVQNAKHALGM
jgi:hypothetical protein